LLYWIAGCGAALALQQQKYFDYRIPEIAVEIHKVIWSSIAGIGIGGVWYGIHCWILRDKAFPKTPGHWFLLVNGASVLIELVTLTIWLRINAEAQNVFGYFFITQACVFIVNAVILCWGLYWRPNRFWTALFAIDAACSILIGIAFIFRLSQLKFDLIFVPWNDYNFASCGVKIHYCVLSTLLFGRLLFELRSNPCPFDWLHRIGLLIGALYVIDVAIRLIVLIWFQDI